jgi:Spy/CpxP family protein refolding chaperone
MRWTVLLGVGFLGVALLVGNSDGQVGEPKKGKDGKATGQLPQGWKELNLTAAQKEKVYEVNAKFKAKLDALTEQEKAIRAEQKAEQYKILTAEQKDALIKNIAGEAPRKEADKAIEKK